MRIFFIGTLCLIHKYKCIVKPEFILIKTHWSVSMDHYGRTHTHNSTWLIGTEPIVLSYLKLLAFTDFFQFNSQPHLPCESMLDVIVLDA